MTRALTVTRVLVSSQAVCHAQIILGANLRLMFAFGVGMLSYYVFAVPILHRNTLTRCVLLLPCCGNVGSL